MRRHGHSRFAQILKGVLIAAVGVALFLGAVDRPTPAAPSDRQVHIAFGFHVNLYHSFRNDTNDESGFGKDIRVIRHIIATLDRCNAQGVPVKAVWDFDNLFSLQEILPRYAPDIITDIRRRVQESGDEVILMSYNNGLVSAMTAQELTDAMRWAVTNPWQSGVQDLFGTYSPIVRPQEMMTTPGNFAIYKQQGIQAVALYYSSTPFDAFRLFSRPLTMAEAHNPILYQNPQTKEEMVVIPTYHIGDLVEHVSLRNWVETLRKHQVEGQLAHDALIFINYDADSELWSGIDLPWPLQWLPNTGGIGALIDEVRHLPNVRFTTLKEYLAGHPPVGRFYFSQDTADGSFNGYNSWAEKADAPRHWTLIERSRRVRAAALKAADLLDHPPEFAAMENLIAVSDMMRLRALSTTHFGMATPFVARDREQAMTDLMNDLERGSDAIEEGIAALLRERLARQPRPVAADASLVWLDSLMVLSIDAETTSGARFLKLHRPAGYQAGMTLVLIGADGRRLPVITVGGGEKDSNTSQLALFIEGPETLGDGCYHLYAHTRSVPPQDPRLRADAQG
ncbi:MAG: hypothetical protein WAU91_22065, partial [Desulfatitalea sp.]